MSRRGTLTRELTPSVAVVIVALLAGFVALAAIEPSVAIILAIFGFVFGDEILRQFAQLLERSDSTDEGDDSVVDGPEDALERLRVRYADGELSESEFERRLEVLLETETVADVERYLEPTSPDGRSSDRGVGELEREPDPEFDR
ncbi:SHOCT domain-containing protein [Natronolimnohabitans innermongolicus]|uniref:SHOCT domain-containing protein n=1 Tax=Natronolimnohabitans innermongolicus JCM 12255 TaxID=1227499 RepID=L9XAI6_9EURY|nr:SHOCT domain-containing protein [Natronolimnohabitans innermongolicus]ELY58647.1 hypothetical protein C493_06572 [Natronolimnohabitans innermongolicus JCM 12255]